ncbi:MAG: nucleotidyl transferase AbiEii/AbiGii toxin family protein [Planctomycetes bacterium]|nr:nucleotidyl transferase AbiEii/AbiGii toxin family protein [Planctomycetota bacterium]
MKLSFLELPSDERRLYIEQAAIRRNVSPVILEKDFWVCWLLGVLFESEFAENLVFKGGTSLSKVFGVIERFSEDIDLSLSPSFLQLPDAGASRNQAKKWMKRAEAACGAAVRDQIGPAMEAAVVGVLGENERAWLEFLTDANTNSPVLLFHYPSSIGPQRSRSQTDSPAIMQIRQLCPNTRPRARRLTNMIFALGSWNGRVSSLEVRGRTMIRQSLARFASSRQTNGCPRCAVTTKR